MGHLAAAIELTWIVLVVESSVPTTATFFPANSLDFVLVAQPIDFFAVKQNERDAVVIDASDGAGSVGRPHPHSGMIGYGALLIGDRA